jgi:tetratricopeptide (TPR) repeat protein
MAEPYLKTLADGGTAESKLQLADYYLSMRRVAEATAVLQPLTKDKATVSAAEIRLAAIAYNTNDKPRGHTMVDAVIAREPANAQALLIKAQWLLTERKPQEALQRTQAAVKAEPRSVAAHYYTGLAHDALRQRKEAMAAFNEVLSINPRVAGAQLQLSRLNLLEGAPDTAVTFAEGALANAPGNPDARVGLVRGLLGRRDFERAAQELAPLVKQYPQVAVVQALNGTLKLMTKDVAGARADYERALSLDKNSLEALVGIISVDLIQNRGPQARERIEARVAAEPNRVELLLMAARVYGAQRDFAKAETTLRRAIQLDSASSRAYSMLAGVLLASGKLDAARGEFDQMAKRDPRNVAAQTMAAMILHSQNKTADAKKRYETIINTDPTAAVAANNLAWIYQEENDRLDDALRLAQSAATRLPDSGEVHDTIGMIYVKKALPALAIEAFEKSIEKQPDNALYHFHLAQAAKDSGDLKRARAAAEQAIKLRPDYPDAQKLLASTKG